MIAYILIGIVLLCFIYIIVLYFVNSKKIAKAQKNKQDKTEKKDDKNQSKVDKKPAVVEVKSQVIKGTMFEEAVKEAEKSGFKYTNDPKADTMIKDNCRLQLDREEFVGEIKKSLETSEIKQQKLSSETNKIGIEGPTLNTNKQIEKKVEDKNTIADDINNLSPQLKALLVNDVLNRKY